MSKLSKVAGAAAGATSLVLLSMAVTPAPVEAASPLIKNSCQRVCTVDGYCVYSCAEVEVRRQKYKRPPQTWPQPEPVPHVENWRDRVLFSSGAGAGGGGGGGSR